MRRLLLLRHAKAVPGLGRDDFDRELTESGEDDARRIGDYIAEHDLTPDMILYSGAARTRATATLVAERLALEIEAFEENALYEASRTLVLALLRRLPDLAPNVLVVGHNPGIAEAANQLTGDGSRLERARMAAKYPTSGLAVLDFKAPRWSEIAVKGAKLERFVTPADLGLRDR